MFDVFDWFAYCEPYYWYDPMHHATWCYISEMDTTENVIRNALVAGYGIL